VPFAWRIAARRRLIRLSVAFQSVTLTILAFAHPKIEVGRCVFQADLSHSVTAGVGLRVRPGSDDRNPSRKRYGR
jgi:hypothetical protein